MCTIYYVVYKFFLGISLKYCENGSFYEHKKKYHVGSPPRVTDLRTCWEKPLSSFNEKAQDLKVWTVAIEVILARRLLQHVHVTVMRQLSLFA